jgi:hypothetical protein
MNLDTFQKKSSFVSRQTCLKEKKFHPAVVDSIQHISHGSTEVQSRFLRLLPKPPPISDIALLPVACMHE